jgi:hypothetical protein
MSVKILDPCGEVGTALQPPIPGFASLSGKRIGALDNGKPNAALVMAELGTLLAQRSGATFVGVIAKRTAAEPAEPGVIEKVVESCDVVLTGSADCGSCTSWSIYDVDQLQKRGVVTVGVTTSAFEVLSREVARTLAMGTLRLAVLEHPFGGIDGDTVRARAAGVPEDVLSSLTTR